MVILLLKMNYPFVVVICKFGAYRECRQLGHIGPGIASSQCGNRRGRL